MKTGNPVAICSWHFSPIICSRTSIGSLCRGVFNGPWTCGSDVTMSCHHVCDDVTSWFAWRSKRCWRLLLHNLAATLISYPMGASSLKGHPLQVGSSTGEGMGAGPGSHRGKQLCPLSAQGRCLPGWWSWAVTPLPCYTSAFMMDLTFHCHKDCSSTVNGMPLLCTLELLGQMTGSSTCQPLTDPACTTAGNVKTVAGCGWCGGVLGLAWRKSSGCLEW